jgi:hypothetical protein
VQANKPLELTGLLPCGQSCLAVLEALLLGLYGAVAQLNVRPLLTITGED